MTSLQEMLRRLQLLLAGSELGEWESDFIANVYARSSNGTRTSVLSGRQVEVIEKLFRRHFNNEAANEHDR